MTIEIVIPARFASSRLPGKPLVKIAGQTLLSRVVDIARTAAESHQNVGVVVATDDERIGAHCDTLNVEWVMTPASCPSGTDRIREAIRQRSTPPDFVINLQGDTPTTPSEHITALIDAHFANPDADVITPVTQLSWDALDALRQSKLATPFSGTCALIDANGRAIWFSKQITPAIRKEEQLRQTTPLSPVFRHIGIYGYTPATLESYVTWPTSPYEELEGLEQLRFLENGCTIQTVSVKTHGPTIDIDSPEDVQRIENFLHRHLRKKVDQKSSPAL